MNTTMIGRNDPCPCGSGKKYKKCHGAKNTVDLNEVSDNELTSIIRKYINSVPPEKKDTDELQQFYKRWSSELAALGEKAAKQLTLGYYLFVKRSDWWQSFLNKQKGHRPAVQDTLNDWINPMPAIGQVIEVKDGYLHMKDLLRGNQYRIPSELKPNDVPSGVYCSGVLLPEKRKGSDVYTYSLSLDFLPSLNKRGEEALIKLAESTKLAIDDFYQEHYLDALLAMTQSEENVSDLTPEEDALINELKAFIKDYGPEKESLLTFFESYLTSQKPTPRKPSALVAAAVRFGKENNFLPNDWTNKQLGEQFGVSTSTIQRYSEEMLQFFGTTTADSAQK